MFHVGRYDPREEGRQKKKKQRRSTSRDKKSKSSSNSRGTPEKDEPTGDHIEESEKTTLRVIAPETAGALSTERKLHTKLNEEAFDDLDIADDTIIEDSGTPGKEAMPVGEDDDLMEEDIGESSTEAAFDPTDEVQRALHVSKLPIAEAAKRWGLAPFLIKNLEKEGHDTFFPIQSLVIPDVIIAERFPQIRARDICVAAPTGSGKTLAFVLPVLNALASRRVRRLRALVVLPSRDLAKQVFEVFDRYTQGSDLKIGLSIGQSDFQAEQKQLVLGDDDGKFDVRSSTRHIAHLRSSLQPGNLQLAIDALKEKLDGGGVTPSLPRGGISAVDVLVCTPGRLVDHYNNTPAFTLQHLRFLVIDEADRLLSQSYHGWIQRVLDGTQAASRSAILGEEQKMDSSSGALQIDPITWRRPEGAMAASLAIDDVICQPVQLRKLLYSATLTRDPQKLAALKLVNPKHFSAHHLTDKGRSASSALYSMPEQLREYTVECTAEQKPLVLLSLLLERLQAQEEGDEKSIVVVFTSSLDSTHRLTRLLQLLWLAADHGEPPIEFSSSLNQQQRSAFMKRCEDPNDPVSVVICSDGMSRGMDIGFVSAVINYDVPGFAKTYVHRCGRTARAGKQGEAISLLKGTGQSGQFLKLRRLIDHPDRVKAYNVKTSLARKAIPLYRGCMKQLRPLLAAEDKGELRPTDSDISEFLPTN